MGFTTKIMQSGTAGAEDMDTGEIIRMELEMEVIIHLKSATIDGKSIDPELLGKKLAYDTIQGWGRELFEGSKAVKYFTDDKFNDMPYCEDCARGIPHNDEDPRHRVASGDLSG